jgi:hypothetical protein
MSRVEPPTAVQALDIAENGDVVATWLDRGVQKTCEVPAVNMVFFLNLQEDRVGLGIKDEPVNPRRKRG